ncbi:MAG: hypothetical protein ACI97A_000375 [Planctomycetota bacterium]|jgi:uncharacterized protein (DUF983 family)
MIEEQVIMEQHSENGLNISKAERRRRTYGLLCPNCGVGSPYLGMFGMRKQCDNCSFAFEREPGYFLGASYINYGICGGAGLIWAVIATFVLHLGWFQQIIVPSILMIVFSCWFFRYARSMWMAFDLRCDPPEPKDFKIPGHKAEG